MLMFDRGPHGYVPVLVVYLELPKKLLFLR
jgi:hypothetical protein